MILRLGQSATNEWRGWHKSENGRFRDLYSRTLPTWLNFHARLYIPFISYYYIVYKRSLAIDLYPDISPHSKCTFTSDILHPAARITTPLATPCRWVWTKWSSKARWSAVTGLQDMAIRNDFGLSVVSACVRPIHWSLMVFAVITALGLCLVSIKSEKWQEAVPHWHTETESRGIIDGPQTVQSAGRCNSLTYWSQSGVGNKKYRLYYYWSSSPQTPEARWWVTRPRHRYSIAVYYLCRQTNATSSQPWHDFCTMCDCARRR
jgi:hypothetical protein